jgi:hypothetical protein
LGALYLRQFYGIAVTTAVIRIFSENKAVLLHLNTKTNNAASNVVKYVTDILHQTMKH